MPDIFWLDTETSGLYHEHEIIQLACCIEHSDGKFGEMHNFKIKPYNFDIVDKKALEVNGITIEELHTFDTADVVMAKLLEILKPYDTNYYNRLTIGGYNTCFDVHKLVNFFARVNSPNHDLVGYNIHCKDYYKYFNNRKIDIMVMVGLIELKLKKQFKSHKLKDVYEYFFPNDNMNWHDATADLCATVKLYKIFLKGLGI